jgi:hypothetical protein
MLITTHFNGHFCSYMVLAKRCGRQVRGQRLCRHEGQGTRGTASMPEALLGVAALLPMDQVFITACDFETQNYKYEII